MIQCPPLEHELETNNGGFFLLLSVSFWCNVVLNPYVFYCLIFRSSPYMKSYRWYVLSHQIVTFISDISVSTTKPVFLLPFTAYYSKGVLKGIIPHRYMLMITGALSLLSLGTIGHMFTFRYVTAKGWKTFPLRYKAVMVGYVLFALVPIFGIELAYRDEKEILTEWSTMYSCITPEILAIPNIMAYDRTAITYYACVPILISTSLFVWGKIFFIVQTYRAINVVVVSKRLKKMQRLFLVQVSLQAFVPFVVIIIPGFPFVLIMILEIYRLGFWSPIFLSSLSSFSLISAIILILMNPNFRIWNKQALLSISTISSNNTPVLVRRNK